MGGMLIVGAGLAGLTVAETLRAKGYGGPVTLIGAEPHAPYQRPPLSKGFLQGETAEAQLMMRTTEAMEKKQLALKVPAGTQSAGAGDTAIKAAAKKPAAKKPAAKKAAAKKA